MRQPVRRWGAPWPLAAALSACGLAGCAAMLEVRPLATGRSDTTAYELTGTDLAALRQQAQRLCPLGGEVLRQTGASQRPEPIGPRWLQWTGRGAGFYAEPPGAAQMVVLCRESADQLRLASAAELAASAAAAKAAADAALPAELTAAPLPVGPVIPEW